MVSHSATRHRVRPLRSMMVVKATSPASGASSGAKPLVPGGAIAIARYSVPSKLLRSTRSASSTRAIVPAPVATASASRRPWRRISCRMASATGKASRPNREMPRSVGSTTSCSPRLASTTSVSTPCVVARAARPAATSTAVQKPSARQRSRLTGRRMRRTTWSSTTRLAREGGPPLCSPGDSPGTPGPRSPLRAEPGGAGRTSLTDLRSARLRCPRGCRHPEIVSSGRRTA